eukprot:1139055-Rhodomonas_salina.1
MPNTTRPARYAYSFKDLLQCRGASTKVDKLSLSLVPEIDLSVPVKKSKKVVNEDTVIRFRKNPTSPGDIKFVEDLDVRVCQIVHAFNLSDHVTWPVLKTFCQKTVGIPALDIRMMRRMRPVEARIMFRTPEEAQQFLSVVNDPSSSAPDNIKWIKGRVARFESESVVPRVLSELPTVISKTVTASP